MSDKRSLLDDVISESYSRVRIHTSIQDGPVEEEEKQMLREAANAAIDRYDTRDEIFRAILKWGRMIADKATSGGLSLL